MNLNLFMEQGITTALKTASRFYIGSRRGLGYITDMISAFRSNAKIRDKYEKKGIHVPPYLIASIASSCNLHCAGCYARAGGACSEAACEDTLDAGEWERIFGEAASMGISIVLLAGGEPLTRKDVITVASGFRSMVFPIFTNGTMIDDEYISLFDEHRNLIPVISIEGSAEDTDKRRGEGVAEKTQAAAKRLKKQKILFGVSVTVTSQNLDAVTEKDFILKLRDSGCGLVFFVEYVPAESGTGALVLSEQQCGLLNSRVEELRRKIGDMIIVAFPGDEEKMGGCLASGRGFFHINPAGGAEPCPFSPYWQLNLKNCSISDVLQSGYFRSLRELEAGVKEHKGGCTLFELKEQVEELAEKTKL